MTYEEEKQFFIDKIIDELSSQSVESLRKIYSLLTHKVY